MKVFEQGVQRQKKEAAILYKKDKMGWPD